VGEMRSETECGRSEREVNSGRRKRRGAKEGTASSESAWTHKKIQCEGGRRIENLLRRIDWRRGWTEGRKSPVGAE